MSVETLKRLRKSGDGQPFSRFGVRDIRYKRSKLDAWMESREGTATSDFEGYKPSIVGRR